MRSPAGFDFAVVGGGSSGAAAAATLARSGATVCLLEAGPDYGPFIEHGWPAELLDPTILPVSHDWDPDGEVTTSRARVIGGCSSHNGCWCVRPSRRDLDDWIGQSSGAWDLAELSAAIDRAERHLDPRPVDPGTLTPVAAGALAAAERLGVPRLAEVNAPDAIEGLGAPVVNVHEGTRWNTRFAYLDPLCGNASLTILSEHVVDRVRWRGRRGADVVAWHGSHQRIVPADRIVLCAGSYGTPAILLRSGVGPEDELRRLGAPLVQVLPGVGSGLADHVGSGLVFAPGPGLIDRNARHAGRYGFVPSQVVWKSMSGRCLAGTWDQFILPIPNFDRGARGAGAYGVNVLGFAMRPRSRGRIRLRSPDPTALPEIDLDFLSDEADHDLEVVLDALAKARELAAALGGLLADELLPGEDVVAPAELAEYVRQSARGYWHATGTCSMRPESDAGSVTAPDGRIHGLDNVYVADASLLATPPSGNPNLPVIAVAELVAHRLAGPRASRATVGRPRDGESSSERGSSGATGSSGVLSV